MAASPLSADSAPQRYWELEEIKRFQLQDHHNSASATTVVVLLILTDVTWPSDSGRVVSLSAQRS
jgi:hypothetical protein